MHLKIKWINSMMSDFYKRTRKNYVDDEGMARGRNLEN
jgi:hypothetical protein